MSLNKDSKIMFCFYGVFLVSVFFFMYYVKDKMQAPLLYYANIGLGMIWASSGLIALLKLNKNYHRQKFWKLKAREQKFILISVVITSIGLFMLLWDSSRLQFS